MRVGCAPSWRKRISISFRLRKSWSISILVFVAGPLIFNVAILNTFIYPVVAGTLWLYIFGGCVSCPITFAYVRTFFGTFRFHFLCPSGAAQCGRGLSLLVRLHSNLISSLTIFFSLPVSFILLVPMWLPCLRVVFT